MFKYFLKKIFSVDFRCLLGLGEPISESIVSLNRKNVTGELTSIVFKKKLGMISGVDESPILLKNNLKRGEFNPGKNRLPITTIIPLKPTPKELESKFRSVNRSWKFNGDGINLFLSGPRERSLMSFVLKYLPRSSDRSYSSLTENLLGKGAADHRVSRSYIHPYKNREFANMLLVVPTRRKSHGKKESGIWNTREENNKINCKMEKAKNSKEKTVQRSYEKKIFSNGEKEGKKLENFSDDTTASKFTKSESSSAEECASKEHIEKSSSPGAIKGTLEKSEEPSQGGSTSACKADGPNLPQVSDGPKGCGDKKLGSKKSGKSRCVVEFKEHPAENLTLANKNCLSEKENGETGINCCPPLSYTKPKDRFKIEDLSNCHPNTATLKYRLAKLPKIKELWSSPEPARIPLPPKPLPKKLSCPKPAPRRRKTRPEFHATGEWKKQKFLFRHRVCKCPPQQPKDERNPVCPPNHQEIRCDHCAPPPASTLLTDICSSDIRKKVEHCPPKRRAPKISKDPCCNPPDTMGNKTYPMKMEESRRVKRKPKQ